METKTYPRNNIVASGMEKEGGVTDISMKNMYSIIAEFGKPIKITLSYNETDWYCTTGTWLVNGIECYHTFTGFSWGYMGTGTIGLQLFFERCGLMISPKEIGEMDKENPEPNEFMLRKDLTYQ